MKQFSLSVSTDTCATSVGTHLVIAVQVVVGEQSVVVCGHVQDVLERVRVRCNVAVRHAHLAGTPVDNTVLILSIFIYKDLDCPTAC